MVEPNLDVEPLCGCEGGKGNAGGGCDTGERGDSRLSIDFRGDDMDVDTREGVKMGERQGRDYTDIVCVFEA